MGQLFSGDDREPNVRTDSDLKKSTRQLIRLMALSFGFVMLLVVCGLVYLYLAGTPPKESKLIAQFYQHRTDYEHLREMLQADQQTISVAEWGVDTTTSSVTGSIPPDGDFPVARYNEYLALLKEVHAKSIFHPAGVSSPDVRIDIWGSGFAGNTRHIQLAWLENTPVDQVASLDDFYRTQQPPHPVFRHIEGNWYLWADW
jgi:hypothetical protein